MNESYSPGRYYQLGWNDRYSGKDAPKVKNINWTDVMYEEYISGYNDCNIKIMRESRGITDNNDAYHGKQFIQE
jgi:hypothetical protein